MASLRVRSLGELVFLVEQFQTLNNYRLHGLHRGRQNFVRNHFVLLFYYAFFQPASARDPEFGIDVHDVYPGGDSCAQILVISSRPAVKRQKHSRRPFDRRDSFDLQMLLSFSKD